SESRRTPAPSWASDRKVADGAGRLLRCGISTRLMTAEGHKRRAQNEQMSSALLPKADVRLARSNKYTPLATCKTYARCGFVLPPDASDKNLHALVMCLQ